MIGVYSVGDTAIYSNPITNMKAKCVVAKETQTNSNVIPVNILDEKGEVIYKNAWVSKENLTFD